MKSVLTFIKRYPAALLALIQSGLALALAFGLHLSAYQVGEIVAFTAGILGLVTQSVVTPVASLQDVEPAPPAAPEPPA